MHEKAIDFLMPFFPLANGTPAKGGIFNISVGNTNTDTDLTGANFAGLSNAIQNGCYITLTATVDIWFRFEVGAGTVDETKTAANTPANQGIFLPAGASVTRMAPLGATHLIAKGVPNAGTLCVEISSRSGPSRIGPGLGLAGSIT